MHPTKDQAADPAFPRGTTAPEKGDRVPDPERVEVALLRNGITFRLNRHRMIELLRRDPGEHGQKPLPALARWHPGEDFQPCALEYLNREQVAYVRRLAG